MLYMIFGGSGSGKSQFAENLSMKLCPGSKVYLATLTDIDEEMTGRIKDHMEMRKGKHFVTIEQGRQLQNLDILGEQLVLLECMTNLLANEMYAPDVKQGETLSTYLMEGVLHVYEQVQDLIVVAGDAFAEVPMDPEFRRYVKESGKVNQLLAAKADVVIEVKFGLPLCLKGEKIYEALE